MPKGGYSCAITHRKRMCKVDFSRWVPINFCVMMGVHALIGHRGVLYHEPKRFSRWFDPTIKDSWESSFFNTIGIKLSWQFSWQAKSSLILAWSFGKRNVPIKVDKTLPHRATFKKKRGAHRIWWQKIEFSGLLLLFFDAVWKDICDIKEFDVKTFNAKLFEFSLSKCWLTKRRQSQTQNWLLMVVEKEWW